MADSNSTGSQDDQHFNFTDVVRSMSEGDWGHDYKDMAHAIKTLSGRGVGLSDAALLELVRLATLLGRACASFYRNDSQQKEQWRDASKDEPPDDAVPFPGAKVGDVFYTCNDLDDGVGRAIVTGKRPDGHIRLVSEDNWVFGENKVCFGWGHKDLYATEAEALAAEAASDVRYYQPKLIRARKVLRAIKEGTDLAPFRNGTDMDEESSESPPP